MARPEEPGALADSPMTWPALSGVCLWVGALVGAYAQMTAEEAERSTPLIPVPVKAVRFEPGLWRVGHGDNWHTTWAADDRQYTVLGDGGGIASTGTLWNTRVYRLNGHPPNPRFGNPAAISGGALCPPALVRLRPGRHRGPSLSLPLLPRSRPMARGGNGARPLPGGARGSGVGSGDLALCR